MWLSVLRVLLFYEQNASGLQLDCNIHGSQRLLQEASALLGELLIMLESEGLFTEAVDVSKQLAHRPTPPASRNNLWFATSCEISKAIPAERIKDLFPKFVLP